MTDAATDKWELAFVLHNLVIPAPSETPQFGEWPSGISFAPEIAAIVSQSDSRITEIRVESKAADHILRSFHDEYGKPYYPAVLILCKAVPQRLRNDLEAIVAFRNAIALSVLLRGRAALAAGVGSPPATWSDSFDFHPAQIGGRGRMVIQSPALLSLVSETAKLKLSPSPYVSSIGARIWADHYLFRSLGKAWMRRYVMEQRGSQFTRSLFRSLEVAYQACSVGAKNEGSIQDYGLQIAHWVSAIEILAWTNRRHVNQEAVFALLAKYPAHRELRTRRFRAKVGKHPRRLNALQRAYTYMYRARNRFLHGNNVSGSSLMTMTRGHRAQLPLVCALVYRAALVAYLDTRYPKQVISFADLATRGNEIFDDHSYDEAFATQFRYELE